MISPHIHVGIQIDEPGHHAQQLYPTSPSDTLAVLFGRVARDLGLTGAQAEWVFLLNGQPLNWASTLGEVSRIAGDPELLLLALTRVGWKREQADGAGGDWGADVPAPPTPSASQTYGGAGERGGVSGTAPGAPPAPKTLPTAPRRDEANSAVFREESAKRTQAPPRREAPATTYGAPQVTLDDDLEDTGERPRLRGVERSTSRQATVRYYHRMNPQRVYPFLVVLSKEEIAEIVQGGVKQTVGERFAVEADSPVEVEPVLPGCQVYPPRHTLVIGPDTQTLEFWVVPQVLGKVKGAKVIVRQNGDTLSEVKLQAKVVQQTAAMVVGALSFVMPYVTKSLKADNPDGSVLQGAMNWVATNLRPEALWAGLALVAVGLYLWCRPRKRDQFWDVTPKR